MRIRVGVSGRGGGGSEFERRVYGDVKRPQRAWLGGRKTRRNSSRGERRVRSREKRAWRESEKRQEGGLRFNVRDD